MSKLPGSSRLALGDGVVHLDEERAVFEAMLTGWERQQRSRMLGDGTVRTRERLVSTGKAAAWAKLAARDWSDYVANRAARR